jgi:hypothetical protein
MANTINDPIKLNFNTAYKIYTVNKEGNQSGEYIDKALGEEMLQALSELLDEVSKKCSIGSDPELRVLLDKWQDGMQAIKKATGHDNS